MKPQIETPRCTNEVSSRLYVLLKTFIYADAGASGWEWFVHKSVDIDVCNKLSGPHAQNKLDQV